MASSVEKKNSDNGISVVSIVLCKNVSQVFLGSRVLVKDPREECACKYRAWKARMARVRQRSSTNSRSSCRHSSRAAAALPRSQAREGVSGVSPRHWLHRYRECTAGSDISRVDVRTISVNRGSCTAECDWIRTIRAKCFTIVTARANLKRLTHGR